MKGLTRRWNHQVKNIQSYWSLCLVTAYLHLLRRRATIRSYMSRHQIAYALDHKCTIEVPGGHNSATICRPYVLWFPIRSYMHLSDHICTCQIIYAPQRFLSGADIYWSLRLIRAYLHLLWRRATIRSYMRFLVAHQFMYDPSDRIGTRSYMHHVAIQFPHGHLFIYVQTICALVSYKIIYALVRSYMNLSDHICTCQIIYALARSYMHLSDHICTTKVSERC